MLIFLKFFNSALCLYFPYALLRERDINIEIKIFGPIGFYLTSAIIFFSKHAARQKMFRTCRKRLAGI